MTNQESSSSEEQASKPSNSEFPRFTLVASVGIMGEEDDCRRFMEIMLSDFNARLHRCNEKIFKGRITLLPIEETLPDEV